MGPNTPYELRETGYNRMRNNVVRGIGRCRIGKLNLYPGIDPAGGKPPSIAPLMGDVTGHSDISLPPPSGDS